MPEIDSQDEGRLREIAYFLWLNEGCPEGRAADHWTLACGMLTVQAASAGEQEVKTSPLVGGLPSNTPAMAEAPAKP